MTPVVLLDGLAIGESPRWHEDRLWFFHRNEHEIIALDVDGRSEVVTRDPEVSPHSIAWRPDGRQLMVPKNPDRVGRLLRREPDGSLVPHAARTRARRAGHDGSLSNRRVWADDLGPDGICMDADGAIWTSPGGTDCVRVREGGEVLQRVELDRSPFACMLGGPDGRTLVRRGGAVEPG
jgi:sugar lactone lactonase YvrE